MFASVAYEYENRFDFWFISSRSPSAHVRIQKVLSEGSPDLIRFYRGSKYRYKCVIIGCLGSFVNFQRIRASIAMKPYSFVIFQGGDPDQLSPLLDPPMLQM